MRVTSAHFVSAIGVSEEFKVSPGVPVYREVYYMLYRETYIKPRTNTRRPTPIIQGPSGNPIAGPGGDSLS